MTDDALLEDNGEDALDELWRALGLDPQDKEGLDAQLRGYYAADWDKARSAYHSAPDDFYAAWWYLFYHPIFNTLTGHSYFDQGLSVYVAKVDPQTRTIEDDRVRNTHVEVWLEHGPLWLRDDAPPEFWDEEKEADADSLGVIWNVHDWLCDVGGDTYEEAICALARRVHDRYGDDRSRVYLEEKEMPAMKENV